MRVIARKTLVDFWRRHAIAEQPLKAWYSEAAAAKWKSFQDVKREYRSADHVGDDRVVFNIKGNAYRLVAAIDYRRSVIFIKYIGTHAEYSKVDAATISFRG